MIHIRRAALAAISMLALTTACGALAFPSPANCAPDKAAADQPGAPAPKLKSGQWPQARSDLKADPNVRFGALPNGMRYAILKNATPPGQASIRLRIAAGSLMETDAQQGLAHFLEHMAFNGSTNVPGRGEMVKELERLGLSFGADTNAGTSFDETVYKFDLPKSDEDSLNTALMLMREIGGNLTLDQDAMDKERGVILSEERVRDTPGYRVIKSRIDFLMAGQLPPKRFPIGLVPVIRTAQRDRIADFYSKYYRPDRATLIVVGDFDPDAMEAKIKARFSDWNNPAPAGADPDLGAVEKRGADFRVTVEPGSQTTLQLAWVTPPDLSLDDVARRRREWVERLGLAVLNRRLATLARGANPPFLAAGALHGDQFRAEEVTALVVNAQPGQWQPALTAGDVELRRAVAFGVRPDELAREVTEQRAALKLAADGAATRRTPAIADEIVGTLGDEEVETHPSDDLALFDTVTKDISAQEVSASLKRIFGGGGPLVFLASPDPIAGGEAALAAAYKTAAAAPADAPAAQKAVDWPYADFGTPGKVAERKDVADLDTVFVRFENGVRLTVKQTKFSDQQVLVKVRIGTGLEGMAPDRQSMAWATSAFEEGGLKQITADDAERALAGKTYGMNFGVEDDAFALTGATRTSDVPTQLQELAAYVTDPGWRPEAFDKVKNLYAQFEDQISATDTGVLSRDLNGLLHSGDRRFTFPLKPDVAGATLDDLKAQVSPALKSGPIEIVMVGDITVDKAIEDVADTFGALPKRPDPADPTVPAHDPALPAPVSQPVIDTHTGRADQAIGFIAWPTNDFFADPQQARANAILGEVLQLKLLDVLRLKEGVTYSPSARSAASAVWPRYGYLSAQIEAPPDKMALFFTDVSAIAADLRNAQVTPDELDRAKKPRIDGLEKAMATNEFWLSGLSGAEVDPRRLDILRSAEASYERVTAADVQKAAQTYMRDDTAWKLVVKPAP